MPKAYEPKIAEDKWRTAWRERGYFKGDPTSDKPAYSIVIPPPNVTGILTMGHVLNNTLQDILIRRKKMLGFEVCWFPGTDHAGIATESKVEKYLRENENIGRDELGREEFIKRVWDWKEEYGGTIVNQLKQLGSSCDWDRERFTMDEGLSKAVQKVFIELYNKGYIYRGRRMINWCPVSKTALSDEEVIHKEVNGYFYHIKYPLSDGSGFLEIATTRPETMLGDSAVAVNPDDIRYKDLIGKTIDLPLTDRKIPIIADEHADPEFGTGCVKITPAHDPNDFIVGQRHDLDIINVMNDDATMNQAAGEEFVGMDRFECREKIMRLLGEAKLVIKQEDHTHSVGYSERGDVPIEPRVSDQWFVKMEELAKPAIKAVKEGEIKFYPERWSKTYFHWMDNVKDWCISRQIWWGHRIPAWHNDATGEIYVGEVTPEEAGKSGDWRQEDDVLDTWFSSWLWPFSIMGWPDDTAEQKFFYPTNDLVTGPDIIFFWVARMIVAGFEFKDAIPFKNVYFTSILRDATGRKLSKSLGNSPDPLDVIDQYGADALRFSIIYIAPLGTDILYSNEKCEIGRNFANKLWNASRFRSMHGVFQGEGGATPSITAEEFANFASNDRWILSRLLEVTEAVNNSLDNFRFHEAVHNLYEFVWSEFCDWYIESSKKALYNDSQRESTLKAFDYTLFSILRILHPFMPFITEELCQELGYVAENSSIVLSEYPTIEELGEVITIDENLLAGMDAKFAVIKAGRNLRATNNIPPSKKIDYFFKPADDKNQEPRREQRGMNRKQIIPTRCKHRGIKPTGGIEQFFNAELSSIEYLMRAEKVVIDRDFVPDGVTPSLITDAGTIFMSLEGLVDIEAEKEKFQKQQKELEGWIKGSRAKLANKNFTDRAPENVVNAARAKLAEMEEKLSRVEAQLKKF